MSDSDEPACGSDRAMVPAQRPENSLSANTSCCLVVPCTRSRLALPTVSMLEPMLADAMAKKVCEAASTV